MPKKTEYESTGRHNVEANRNYTTAWLAANPDRTTIDFPQCSREPHAGSRHRHLPLAHAHAHEHHQNHSSTSSRTRRSPVAAVLDADADAEPEAWKDAPLRVGDAIAVRRRLFARRWLQIRQVSVRREPSKDLF